MLYKVLIIASIGHVLCTSQNATLDFNILTHGSIYTCENRTATVLEGEPLTIQVYKLKYFINKIWCRHITNKKEVFTTSVYNNYTTVPNVTVNMGTVWNCTVLFLQGLQTTQRTAPCPPDNGTCVAIDCLLKMHVRRTKAPQVILVNSMLLPSTRAGLRESHDALAEYTYNDGDLVDVTCANPIGLKCSLRMHYKDRGNWSNEILEISDRTHTSKDPVGFRLRMRAADDGTHALCTCLMGDDITTVRVNIHMKKHFAADFITVYVNNTALRATAYEQTDYDAIYEYLYIPHEEFNVTCANESEELGDVYFAWIKDNNNMNKSDKHEVIQHFNAKNREESSFECWKNKYKIKVTLKPRDLYEEHYKCSLQAELRDSTAVAKASLELYDSNKQYLFYEYKDEDTFNLTCTVCCEQGMKPEIELIHSGLRLFNTHRIVASDIHKDNVYQCTLNKTHAVYIVFVRYAPTTTPTTTTSSTTTISTSTTTTSSTTTTRTTTAIPQSDTAHHSTKLAGYREPPQESSSETSTNEPGSDQRRLLAAVGSVISIVIFIVVAIIYKIKNRNTIDNLNPQLQPGEVYYENLRNDSSIPLLPPQWEPQSHYAEPVDNIAESTYCEPCAGALANVRNELYTMPIPKDRRKSARNQTSHPTYEELDTDRSTVVQNATDDPNYAEVEPDASKNNLNLMYAQVPPKAERQNLNGRDSHRSTVVQNATDDPNYAEVAPDACKNNLNLMYAQVPPKVERQNLNGRDPHRSTAVQNASDDPNYEELDEDRATVVQNVTDDPNYEELGTDRSTTAHNATDDPNYEELDEDRATVAHIATENSNYTEIGSKVGSDYSNIGEAIRNYAQVVPKTNREKDREGAGRNKYVNMQEGAYVNASTEYAEPAYCEPTYLNSKK